MTSCRGAPYHPIRPVLGSPGTLRFRARVFVALLALFAFGCDQECRTLCTAWFDYQRDVCGVVDSEDERVTCISDYRSGRVSDEELQECTRWAARIEALDAADDSVCCDATGPGCASGDDDDSAGG